MNVGNLLELERALERNRIVDSAAEVEKVPSFAILACDLFDRALGFEDGIDLIRDGEDWLQELLRLHFIDTMLSRGDMNRQQIERLDLRYKAFRRGHADFGTAASVELRMGLACDG